jgi:hypothetical protein
MLRCGYIVFFFVLYMYIPLFLLQFMLWPSYRGS